MRVVIFGGRDITDKSLIEEAIKESGFEITEVVEGGQRTEDDDGNNIGGADWWAKQWAIDNNMPYQTFHANWPIHRKAAGPIRNSKMADYVAAALPDAAAIAIWDGQSRGTKDMLDKVQSKHIPFYVKEVQPASARNGDAKAGAIAP